MNTFHAPTSPILYRVLEIKMGHLCHLCGARFLLLSTMISHLETHRLGYMCLRCGFISPTIIHQSLHDRVCATNSAPVYLVFKAYQCPVCKYCSSNTSDMLHHVLRRHEVFPIRHFCLKKKLRSFISLLFLVDLDGFLILIDPLISEVNFSCRSVA